jgi:hypothetical protein
MMLIAVVLRELLKTYVNAIDFASEKVTLGWA